MLVFKYASLAGAEDWEGQSLAYISFMLFSLHLILLYLAMICSHLNWPENQFSSFEGFRARVRHFVEIDTNILAIQV